jgi:flagellar protein FliO/FliZ
VRIRLLACAALAFLIAPAGALAADGFKKDTTPLPSDLTGTDTASTAASDGGSGIGRLVFGLIVVVGLVLALRWFVKRANRDRTSPDATGSLQVVATTPLAQGRAVHLLRVGDELVLVGSAEQGVTPLRVYSSSEARNLEQTLDAAGPFVETSGGAGIGSFLHDLRKRTAR